MAAGDPQPGVPTPSGTLRGVAVHNWSGGAWTPAGGPSSPTPTGTLDGIARFTWDGSAWQPAASAGPGVATPGGTLQGAALFDWDGSAWQPSGRSGPVVATPRGGLFGLAAHYFDGVNWTPSGGSPDQSTPYGVLEGVAVFGWNGSAWGPAQNLDVNLISGGALDSRVTFTRASGNASYFNSAGVLQIAATNVPRLDYDPVTHAPLGLLIEESRINLCLQSQAINVGWTKTDTTVADNSTTSPDGTVDASLCTEGVAGTALVYSASGTVTAGAIITGSAFLKRGNCDWMRVVFADAGPTLSNGMQVWVNLATGAVGTIALRGSGTVASATIRAIGNGWYRVTGTFTGGGASVTAAIGTTTALADNNAGRVSNGTYYLWGGQIEQNAFATSYIPTIASTVTRAVDQASMAIGSWFNALRGSFVSDFMTAQAAASGTQAGILRLDDGTANNQIGQFIASNGNMLNTATAATVIQLNSSGGATVMSAANKLGLTYGGALWTSAGNGSAPQNGTGGTTIGTPTRLFLGGSNVNPAAWLLNGWIRRLRYWPRNLSNTELQQVTT
jgi:hypothetical protein